jgi:hypothetical protein
MVSISRGLDDSGMGDGGLETCGFVGGRLLPSA